MVQFRNVLKGVGDVLGLAATVAPNPGTIGGALVTRGVSAILPGGGGGGKSSSGPRLATPTLPVPYGPQFTSNIPTVPTVYTGDYGTTRGPLGSGSVNRDKVGRPLVTEVGFRQTAACPNGYVAVDMNGDGVADACVLRAVAVSAGLWRAKRKPPISAGDWRKLQVAERVKAKAKAIAGKAGFVCRGKGSRGK